MKRPIIKRMVDIDLSGRRVLIRLDLNVPISNGKILSDRRIIEALPTIKLALENGAGLVLLSHLGRPEPGKASEAYSLAPVAERLSALLAREVQLKKDWLDRLDVRNGDVILCENVRFNVGETDNSSALSQKIAMLGDVFVMDAFGAAHRAHASTEGVARYAAIACGGPLLIREIDTLYEALHTPARPLAAIVGGSKVSTKLTVLQSLSVVVDYLIPGGGIANTFLAAAGYPIGKSLHEPALIKDAQNLLSSSTRGSCRIGLPSDVVVAKKCKDSAPAHVVSVSNIAADDLILDIGPDTVETYEGLFESAATIVWNGPVGVFEIESFSNGTRRIAESIAKSSAYSVAGGGDTLAALEKYSLLERISYISTGGGAFLEFLEGKSMPALTVLEERASN